jgi:4-carboxymuconolactone decarboxylase
MRSGLLGLSITVVALLGLSASAQVAPDIDKDSGYRLPLPNRATLDAETQRAYDRLFDANSGALAGARSPAAIQLYSPGYADHLMPLNRYLRFDAGISGRVRELAILVTARVFDSQIEWTAHEPEARRQNVPAAAIEAVKNRAATTGLAAEDETVIALGREMFEVHKVSSATFARAVAQFGPAGLINVIGLMGNYAGTAALLTTFDMQLPAGQAPLLPQK